jgi:hypothetical protein
MGKSHILEKPLLERGRRKGVDFGYVLGYVTQAFKVFMK